MTFSRRRMLGGIGATVLGGFCATTVLGSSQSSLEITNVHPGDEYIVLANNDDSEFDLSGCVVAFEYGNSDKDQRRTFRDGTTIKGNDTLTVASGAEIAADIDEVFDYETEVINNDGNDVIAILSPDESKVITRSDESGGTPTTTTTTTTTSDEEETTTTNTTTKGDSETTTESNEETMTENGEETTERDNDGSNNQTTEDC